MRLDLFAKVQQNIKEPGHLSFATLSHASRLNLEQAIFTVE
jgi:hypothetical protein